MSAVAFSKYSNLSLITSVRYLHIHKIANTFKLFMDNESKWVNDLEVVKALMTYYGSGDESPYENDLRKVGNYTIEQLENLKVPKGRQPAIVLDIDETTLRTNGECIKKNIQDMIFNREEWKQEWIEGIKSAELEHIETTLELFNLARQRNFSVFFITARRVSLREPTERNLRLRGFENYTRIIFRQDKDNRSIRRFKRRSRKNLEKKGFMILLNIGDQKNDIADCKSKINIRLPNPFYTAT